MSIIIFKKYQFYWPIFFFSFYSLHLKSRTKLASDFIDHIWMVPTKRSSEQIKFTAAADILQKLDPQKFREIKS